MKKKIALILALVMLAACTVAAAEGNGNKKVPSFLTPSEFLNDYSFFMGATEEKYAEQLNDSTVRALRKDYTFRQKDSQGTIVYYGTKDWEVEAAFYYPEGNADDYLPAKLMNINIRNDTNSALVTFAKQILTWVISEAFDGEVAYADLYKWFKASDPSADPFALPGYMLGVILTDEHTQYVILPTEGDGLTETSGGAAQPLPGLKEAQETLAAGKEFSVAYYKEGTGDKAEKVEISDQKGMSILWGAVNALQLGERTEAPTEGTPSEVSFWFRNNTSFILDFEGQTLKTAEGEYYTLLNDEPLRSAVKELTDRYRLTVRIEGVPCVLGESTPQDLIDHGLGEYSIEQDGTISFSDYNGESWLYVNTAHGQLDEPILAVNAFWTKLDIEYCGFDGGYGTGWLDDPDAVWSTDGLTVDERDNLIDSGELLPWDHWEGLGAWLTERFGAVQSEEGITEAAIPLSDGRTVYVSTNGTPVYISLLPN